MARIVLLDSGPLGLVSNPSEATEPARARVWVEALVRAGATVVVPEIADYEVRRELLRAGKSAGVARLDALLGLLGYVALETAAMRLAAALWAQARAEGHPTAHDAALDGDVILAAQARTFAPGGDVVVATTNPSHLRRYVEAQRWDTMT